MKFHRLHKTLIASVMIMLFAIGADAQGSTTSDTAKVSIEILIQPSSFSAPPCLLAIYKNADEIKFIYAYKKWTDNLGAMVSKKDSVTLKKADAPGYNNLINQLKNTSIQELENTDFNKNRMMFDDSSFTFTISYQSTIKTAKTQSPDPTRYPVIYAFMKQTIKILANTKAKGVLDNYVNVGR